MAPFFVMYGLLLPRDYSILFHGSTVFFSAVVCRRDVRVTLVAFLPFLLTLQRFFPLFFYFIFYLRAC